MESGTDIAGHANTDKTTGCKTSGTTQKHWQPWTEQQEADCCVPRSTSITAFSFAPSSWQGLFAMTEADKPATAAASAICPDSKLPSRREIARKSRQASILDMARLCRSPEAVNKTCLVKARAPHTRQTVIRELTVRAAKDDLVVPCQLHARGQGCRHDRRRK